MRPARPLPTGRAESTYMHSGRFSTPRPAGRGGAARRPDGPLRAPPGNLILALADTLPAAHHALTGEANAALAGDTLRAPQGAPLRPIRGDETRAQGGARIDESPR